MKYNDSINYCGPYKVFSLPRKYFGVDINYSCYVHDKAYLLGDDRSTADKQFREDVYNSFVNAGKSKVLAYIVSRLAYVAAKFSGKVSKFK